MDTATPRTTLGPDQGPLGESAGHLAEFQIEPRAVGNGVTFYYTHADLQRNGEGRPVFLHTERARNFFPNFFADFLGGRGVRLDNCRENLFTPARHKGVSLECRLHPLN